MESDYLKHLDALDGGELALLMDRYGNDVWKYAYALTRNRQQAEDISQEVFMKAHRHFSSYRGQSSVRTWLLAITRNQCMNYLTSAYFRKIGLRANVFTNKTVPSAEAVYIGKQSAEEVWRVILGLSKKLREVLVLDLEHELTVQETAQLLSLPEGTVKSRLHRARAEVEKRLKEGTT